MEEGGGEKVVQEEEEQNKSKLIRGETLLTCVED